MTRYCRLDPGGRYEATCDGPRGYTSSAEQERLSTGRHVAASMRRWRPWTEGARSLVRANIRNDRQRDATRPKIGTRHGCALDWSLALRGPGRCGWCNGCWARQDGEWLIAREATPESAKPATVRTLEPRRGRCRLGVGSRGSVVEAGKLRLGSELRLHCLEHRS